MLLFFAVSLFVSSTLLFLVQPLIGKMILPRLGGTPAVWNTCMVFFQAVLLVGYAYTHSLTTWGTRRAQVGVHVALLLVPLLVLPFALGDWEPSLETNPVFAVLWLLLGLVGVPFFVVATSAPLLQKWFTHTGHAAAKDPYFLYGASNLGSMLALVLYPVAVEPFFSLETQSTLWTIGYGMLVALVAACGLIVWWTSPRAEVNVAPALAAATATASAPLSAPAPAAKTATAIQPAKRTRRSRAFMLAESTPSPAPVEQPNLEGKQLRLRLLGLASLPLGAMLFFTKYLEPELAGTPILWSALWGVYLAGFLQLCWVTPWKWLDDTRLTFLVLQPVAMVAVFAGLLKEFGLPGGLWFVLFLTALCFPIYFLFGEGVKPTSPLDAPTWGRRLRWIGLAAAPSSLMLGVTTYLTTDIAAIPLFWVIPLALYLLTFILVFLRWPAPWTGLPHTVVLWIQPVALLALVLVAVAGVYPPAWATFILHLSVFFLTALVCHGELAKDRPASRYLTEFYLWMSVGGVLGGIFNGLLAPVAFQFGVVEYPLAVLLALLLRPNLVGRQTLIPGDSTPRKPTELGRALDLFLPLVVGLFWFIIAGLHLESKIAFFGWDVPVGRLLLFLVGCVCLVFASRPLRLALAVAALVVAAQVHSEGRDDLIHEERGFFGFLRVREYAANDKLHDRKLFYRTLYHGGINHGSQYIYYRTNDGHEGLLRPETRRRLITYFTPASGIGQVFESFKGLKPSTQQTVPGAQIWTDARLPAAVVGLGGVPYAQLIAAHSEMPYGVVGLGLGTLAAQARPFQHMTFYEIDPGVVRLSEGDDPYFYYLKDARNRGAKVDIVLGDGRLTLRKAPERYYHIIVLDAFSGDAIPVHLLTDDAIKEYLAKLVDGGVLIFNTTNRYIDLRPVLADLAERNDMICLGYGDWNREEESDRFTSDWVVLQRKLDRFKVTRPDGTRGYGPHFNGSVPLTQQLNLHQWDEPPATGEHVWTDRYSNLLRVMNWKTGL